MFDHLSLEKQIYRHLSDPERPVRLLIVPDELYQSQIEAPNDDITDTNNFMILGGDADANNSEMIIPKSTMKLIFKQCYPLIQTHLQGKEVAEQTLFLATTGIMMMLNEHTTVINLHYNLLIKSLTSNDLESKIEILGKELAHLRSLLTSNNPKINKSSSLWTLFKKLYIHIITHEITITGIPKIHEYFLQTCLDSAKAHRNNYYAWLALKFLVNISFIRDDMDTLGLIKSQVWAYAQGKWNESATWSTFVSCFTPRETVLHCVRVECLNWESSMLEATEGYYYYASEAIRDEALDEVKRLIHWVYERNVTMSVVPYEALKNLISWCLLAFEADEEYVHKVRKEVESISNIISDLKQTVIEQLGPGDIIVKNGYYLTSNGENVDDVIGNLDMIRRERVLVYCHWVRLQTFLSNFYYRS